MPQCLHFIFRRVEEVLQKKKTKKAGQWGVRDI